MSKINGEDLFFPDVTPPSVNDFRALLLRRIYRDLRITDDEFMKRVVQHLKISFPDSNPRKYTQKIVTDRKFFMGDSITDKMFAKAMSYIGFEDTVLENTDSDNIIARARDTKSGQAHFFTF